MNKRRYLLGGTVGWKYDNFVAADDCVHGGKSQSFMEIRDGSSARFYGHLDSGAGFASQHTIDSPERAWNLSRYTGIELVTERGDDKQYQLNLKTADPRRRSDEQLTSMVEYKYQFIAPSERRTFYVPFAELTPYHRGYPAHDAPELDLANISTVSLMITSLFGHQEGDFDIEFVSVAAVVKQSVWDRAMDACCF